jgi:hypothetical protein
VALRIAKGKKPQTVMDTQLEKKKCAMEMAELMCDKCEKIKTAQIPSSNDAIQYLIKDMA